jgi:uncharacterized protein YbjQ (UPF0145 family)
MSSLIFFLILLAVGFFFGRANEAAHLKRLETAEHALSHIAVNNLKHIYEPTEAGGVLVSGNVVVAVDYFKKIIANVKMIFGGKLGMYDSLISRARREAVVRMLREADALGADAVYNVRVEFSAIGAQPQAIGGAELLAYGTAIKRRSGPISPDPAAS